MTLTFISFLAGILTVLAPCTFPLLPVILGSSVSNRSKLHPYLVILGLVFSLVTFTLLLKLSTAFINLPPDFWRFFSFLVLLIIGLIIIFPNFWDSISVKLNLSKKSDDLLENAMETGGYFGSVLTGVALGPVFSSCSPTYVIALSTVLQGNWRVGLINMFAYLLGLALIMLLLALLGQKLASRIRWMANPGGWFKKFLGVLFILVGLSILTGFDKQLELALAEINPLNPAKIEQRLLRSDPVEVTGQTLNVFPPKQAPEIHSTDNWINSAPLKIEDLKEKVVLIDFWTYSCINCIRTQPYLKNWHAKYNNGLVIIGVHAPEFAFEKKLENVSKAVSEAGIEYPVVLDNDFETWKAFNNQYWPAKYLIDTSGKIRYQTFGEGRYQETEKAIQYLLLEGGYQLESSELLISQENISDLSSGTKETPETYLGWSREFNQVQKETIAYNKIGNYTYPSDLSLKNQWSLEGEWEIRNEFIVSGDKAKLKLNFSAKEVYLVAGTGDGQSSKKLKVLLNGNPPQTDQQGQDLIQDSILIINQDKMYKVLQLPKFSENQTLELEAEKGVKLHVFTFGS